MERGHNTLYQLARDNTAIIQDLNRLRNLKLTSVYISDIRTSGVVRVPQDQNYQEEARQV